MKLSDPFHRGCPRNKHKWFTSWVIGTTYLVNDIDRRVTFSLCLKCGKHRYTPSIRYRHDHIWHDGVDSETPIKLPHD